MEQIKYYKGNLKYDSEKGGHQSWIIGEFMEEGPRKTKLLEVKYWEFEKGLTSHQRKIQSTLEVVFLLEGELIGEIEGKAVTLKSGEYLVIEPNVMNNIAIEAKTFVRGLTIKAPSDMYNKKIVG